MTDAPAISPAPSAAEPVPGRLLIAACAAIFLCALALRWWIVLSGRAVVDGDESIVGLMALHWLRGEPGLYFWGQPYGAGAGIESALAALLFKIWSPSGEALKAAGLLVWTGFALAVALAARKLFGRRASWLALALIAVFPAAAEWSMKIRGGHFLSFAAFALAFWPAARVWDRSSRPLGLAAVGAALCFISPFLQPITLVPAGVLVGMILLGALRRRAWSAAAAATAGGLLVVLLALYIAAVPGIKPHSSVEGDWMKAAARVFAFAFLRFFTPWLDPATVKIRPLEEVAALIWMGASLLAVAAAVVGIRRPGRDRAALAAMLATAAASFVGAGLLSIENLQPRHLFALYPLLCLLLAWAGARLRPGLLAVALVVLLLAAGALNYRVAVARVTYSPSTGAAVRTRSTVETLKLLQSLGIHYVFVADYDFKWNLAFFSGEDVIGRGTDPRDRYLPYVQAVTEAADRNLPVAVIFYGQIDYGHGRIAASMVDLPGVQLHRPDPDVLVLTGVPPTNIFKYFLRNEREVREIWRKRGRTGN